MCRGVEVAKLISLTVNANSLPGSPKMLLKWLMSYLGWSLTDLLPLFKTPLNAVIQKQIDEPNFSFFGGKKLFNQS